MPTDREIDGLRDRQTDRQTDRQMKRQEGIQADQQTTHAIDTQKNKTSTEV